MTDTLLDAIGWLLTGGWLALMAVMAKELVSDGCYRRGR
jgi:hypothetical protein